MNVSRSCRLYALAGALAGLTGSLLGAGGGMLLVPLLQRAGLSPVKSHATSVAVMLPLVLCSTLGYLWRGELDLAGALPYLLPVLAGAAAGAWLLPKLSARWLHRLFGLFMLWAAWRMVRG